MTVQSTTPLSSSIGKNITWLTVANFAVKPAWFVFITYVCIRQIGVSSYGTMTAALALMSIVDGILSLGTNQYTVRELAREKSDADRFFTNFVLLRLVTATVAVLVGIAVEILVGNSAILVMAFFAGTYVLSRSLTDYCRSFYRAAENFRSDALSTVLEKLLVIALGTLFVLAWPTAESLLFGMTVGMTITLIANWIWINKRFAAFNRVLLGAKFLRRTMPDAIPLGLASIFVLIYFRTDSFMVDAMVDSLAAGQYAIGFRVLEALIIIPSIVVTVILPRMSRLYHVRRKDFSWFSVGSTSVVTITALIVAGTVYFSAPAIVQLIDSSSEAKPAVRILQTLIWSFPFAALNYVLSTIFVASDRQRSLAVILGCAALVNITLNFYLIPLQGASGAAVATIVTQLFVTIAFLLLLFTTHRNNQGVPGSVTTT